MALDQQTKKQIHEYVTAHLGDEDWHNGFFDFIDDPDLAVRLGEEFISTRYIYKILESVMADQWLLRAQIRLQIISYASIYEASIHHLLFENFKERSEVLGLTEFPMKKVISIPSESLQVLKKHLEHDGKEIMPTYEGIGRTKVTSVRFDRKAECARDLGLIDDWLCDDLIEIYEGRNAIHIHAEIRKSLDYQLELSKTAYRRLKPFKEQISERISNIPKT